MPAFFKTSPIVPLEFASFQAFDHQLNIFRVIFRVLFTIGQTLPPFPASISTSTGPAWQSENERFTRAQTVADGFSAATTTVSLSFIEPTSRPEANSHQWSLEIFFAKAMLEHQALRHMIGSLLDE
jgi:hypothetical protein